MPDHRISVELRQRVTERARYCCEYCRSQAKYATQAYSVEHILARARGGATTIDNLALACQGCNNHKYDKTEARDPASDQFAPLYHPRHDRWDEHFTWSADFALLIGLTPTGRATVDALSLNRDGVVNLRRLLYAHGEHPPKAPTSG
ncbi:MAG: HNH endonuclease [Chloroflexota bacterium]|nr:HNH endonuclease [Chloroflexota bacterium]